MFLLNLYLKRYGKINNKCTVRSKLMKKYSIISKYSLITQWLKEQKLTSWNKIHMSKPFTICQALSTVFLKLLLTTLNNSTTASQVHQSVNTFLNKSSIYLHSINTVN
jgi:hypothetical protein